MQTSKTPKRAQAHPGAFFASIFLLGEAKEKT